MTTCLDLVKREISDLTEKELDDVLDQMRERQARIIADGGDPTTAAAQAGREVADLMRAAIAIEKRNAAINFKVRTEALDYIRTTWADDPVEGVKALIYGSPKSRAGSRASVVAAQEANWRKYAAGVEGDLERAGLFDVLRRGELDRDVARAMWHAGDDAELAKLPQQAVDIANILQKWQEVAREDGNRHGAWIGKLDNYVVRQSHDPNRIERAGEADWKADIVRRLDFDKTFPDGPPKNLDDWLHETFLNLTTGVRPKGDLGAERMAAFKGPGNLAKKLSQERVLHFKSPDDWFDYNAKFGFGNLRESYVTGLHRAAESNGLLQVLGTNPEHNLSAVMQAIRSNLSRKDPELLKEFDRRTRSGKSIENAYKEVSGQTRRVASQRLATVGASIRVWNTLTGLGGAVVSAITDVPVRASALRFQGQNYLQALAEGMGAPLMRIAGIGNTAERKATLSAIGYFNEIALGNLAARFSPDESVPGRLQRATHTFFKWNLLGGWTDTMRRSSLEAMGRFFGDAAENDLASLSPRTQKVLANFRIGEAEWNVMRKALVEEGEHRFMTPQAVRELGDEHFTGLAAPRISALKQDLAERVQAREARDAVEQGWVQERAAKFRAGLAEANAKLSERAAAIDDRGMKRVRDLQERIAGLLDRVDDTEEFWDDVRDTRPTLGEFRRRGKAEARAAARVTEISTAMRSVARDLNARKGDLDVAFVERWNERRISLERRLDGADEATANGMGAELDALFTEANAYLTDRRQRMDDAAAGRLDKLQERLQAAQSQVAESAAFWKRATEKDAPVGQMRRAGVSEGRAREAMRRLNEDVRQIGRDIDKAQQELSENFELRWSDRQDDLIAFADRVTQRIRERAEWNAKDLASLEPQIKRILNDTREATADKLQQLYADEVNAAVISPDARTMAFVRQGQEAGTPVGESLRLFWQFKTFGIAIMQRAFLREFYGGAKGAGGKLGTSEMQGLALLMLGGLSFGYMAMSAKDMLKGKTPRPLDNPKTWGAAMAQGGAMGIYGDFMFGQSSRFGQGFLQTLGGPTVGKADAAYQLWSALKSGDDAASKTFKFTLDNTPYANLFYTRMALDYLFLYEIQESMNPGYLRRMERRAEQENGQEWWLRPSEVVN